MIECANGATDCMLWSEERRLGSTNRDNYWLSGTEARTWSMRTID